LVYKCPNCGTELIYDGDRVYETLCEHVSNPNTPDAEPRETFVCPNRDCWFHNRYFWDVYGSGGYCFRDTGADIIVHMGLYNGFYHDAIDDESDTERPHPPPEEPLLRSEFCAISTKGCPIGRECTMRCKDEEFAERYGYVPSGKIESTFICQHLELENVQAFFDQYRDVKWHKS